MSKKKLNNVVLSKSLLLSFFLFLLRINTTKLSCITALFGIYLETNIKISLDSGALLTSWKAEWLGSLGCPGREDKFTKAWKEQLPKMWNYVDGRKKAV